jgi:hypothetical protein
MKIKNTTATRIAAALFSFTLLVTPLAALAAGPASANLQSAGNFTILAKSGISATGTTSITGNIAVSPAAATFITGFGLGLSSDTTFSTSKLIVGKAYASDYTAPTPAMLTTAISDMQNAYTDAAGRTNPTATELGAGNLGGLTITPGLYKWGTGVTIPSNVTLSGGANDIWIFQIAQTLSVSSGVQVILSGGAQASNIFWVVAGQTTLGTTANFSGTILDQTAIVMNTGATLTGRALAQTAVTLDANTIVPPAGGAAVAPTPIVQPVVSPTPTPTSTPTPSTTSTATSSSNTTSTNPNTAVTTQTATQTVDYGCVVGNTFSATTGRQCLSFVSNPIVSTSAVIVQIRNNTSNLNKGMNDPQVTVLQQFLIAQNKGVSAQALAAHGTTTFFGALTLAALAEFQASVGISPAIGNFGPITRGYISAHY